LPQPVWSYISSSVKKNSGIFKRLLRVSEFWIFENKDWGMFQKKFKALVLDFLYRQLFVSK
jgi:hypothetical protein